MKKIIALVLMLMMSFTLVACQNKVKVDETRATIEDALAKTGCEAKYKQSFHKGAGEDSDLDGIEFVKKFRACFGTSVQIDAFAADFDYGSEFGGIIEEFEAGVGYDLL